MPHRKTILRITDSILYGQQPRDPITHFEDTGWLLKFNGCLTFGATYGAVLGLSVKRESLSWVIAGVGQPIACGHIDVPILPLQGEKASIQELEEHLVDVLMEIAEQLPSGLPVGGVGVSWPGSVGPLGEARDFPIHHTRLRSQNSERNQPLGPIIRNALRRAELLEEPEDGNSKLFPTVAIVNDADADLLFEARQGAVQGISNVMGLKVCGGIGMGIMIANRLVSDAGHIEHIKVRRDPDTFKNEWSGLKELDELPLCSCTGADCVGRFATGAAIIEQLDDYFESEEMTPNERGRQIEKEDSHGTVTKVCGRAGRLLGQALIGPVLALNPERLVVNTFPRNDHLFGGIRTGLTEGTAVRLKLDDIVQGGQACEDPTVAGAAQFVVETDVVPRMEQQLTGGRMPQRHELPPWLRLQIPMTDHAVPDYRAL